MTHGLGLCYLGFNLTPFSSVISRWRRTVSLGPFLCRIPVGSLVPDILRVGIICETGEQLDLEFALRPEEHGLCPGGYAGQSALTPEAGVSAEFNPAGLHSPTFRVTQRTHACYSSPQSQDTEMLRPCILSCVTAVALSLPLGCGRGDS